MIFRKLTVLALAAVFGTTTFAQGLPDLGDASSAALSESQERTIGNRIMREVRVDKDYVDDPEVADYITSLGERLLRANRLNEFKGAPSYLRTHPLTTERIADIQDRLLAMNSKLVPDSFEYRIARAKLRSRTGSPTEAVALFRTMLADKTVVRPREEVYGLALSLRRARDFETAWKTLAPLREGPASHPAFDLLAGQLLGDMGRVDEALAMYRAAMRTSPQHRGLSYAYYDLLLQTGRTREVIAELEQRLRGTQDDARLYELQARAFAASGQRIAQHRAQAEAHYRRGNLAAAVDQLEIAVKTKSDNFYELSSAESRLRELRALLENEKAAEKALKIS